MSFQDIRKIHSSTNKFAIPFILYDNKKDVTCYAGKKYDL